MTVSPLILIAIKDVLHAALDTKLVSTWLDNLVEGTKTKLDDYLVKLLRTLVGIEDEEARDSLVRAATSEIQKMYDTLPPEKKAVLTTRSPLTTQDIMALLGMEGASPSET